MSKEKHHGGKKEERKEHTPSHGKEHQKPGMPSKGHPAGCSCPSCCK